MTPREGTNVVQTDVARFQLRRVNPFTGLMIDASVWRDAHDYHRTQMRLHHLALHGWGIVQGLEVSLAETENTVQIAPGIALDPAGNFVIVSQPYAHQIEVRQPGTVYLILQFSEVPSGPHQPAGDGTGHPTRILEAYRIYQREQLPAEPCLELARIQVDPSHGPIRAAQDPANPGVNELDTRFRPSLGAAPPPRMALELAPAAEAPPPLPEVTIAPAATSVATPPPAPPPPQPEVAPAAPSFAPAPGPPLAPSSAEPQLPLLVLAVAAHGAAGWDRHRDGLRYLAREVEAGTGRPVRVLEVAPAEADGIDLLYFTGYGRLALSDADVEGLARVMQQGGVVLAEGCAAGPNGEAGAREFARSFVELAIRLDRQLARVERGHPVLVARHVFGEPPPGAQTMSMLAEAGGMVYSYADYGCAWQGGPPDRALPRGTIRDALEFGVNLALYRRVAP
jgi:hypothetical protein